MSGELKTYHAPAERATLDEISRQSKLLLKEDKSLAFINSIPLLVVILNEQRQIIHGNQEFKKMMEQFGNKNFLGQRTGEALFCIHSNEMEAGCGTSEACSTCGAVNAIMFSQRQGKKGVEECSITTKDNDCFDFLVWATPIEIQGENFTIFALSDIANEKRRKALERIFFHDVLNTAGGLRGFIGLLNEADESELQEYLTITDSLTEKLIDEIKAQRVIALAENNELVIKPKAISTLEVLEEVKLLYERHEVTQTRKLEIEESTVDIIIETDKTILRRIIGNLVKNALEAISQNESVILGCKKLNDKVVFSVHNSSVMSKDIKLQMFKRSFSTKGTGRGLGTYSTKLLTERYLKGKVSFESEPEKGTTFWITLDKKIAL